MKLLTTIGILSALFVLIGMVSHRQFIVDCITAQATIGGRFDLLIIPSYASPVLIEEVKINKNKTTVNYGNIPACLLCYRNWKSADQADYYQ